MSIDQSTIQLIPLNRLVASPRNVRRKDRKADIEALAASIASRGLLQNLCAAPAEGDRYEVDAGGRRLLALKLLARTGVIAKNWPVPCNVVAREAGREVSLIENVHRVAMDAMDEVDAYAALIADGSTPDEVARRFGVLRRHVDQRLALAKLSPKIKAAWKRGDLSLDAPRAFCLVDDHARQDAVFRSLGKPVTHAASVRSRLMEGGMRASDRHVQFIGLEAYEAAGGKLLRDLFDPEAVFIEDPALVISLADTALQAQCEAWTSKGWGWVEASLDGRPAQPLSAMRLQPDWRDPTASEQVELDRLASELATLDAALDAHSIEDDPRWTQRDELEAQYEAIRQAARAWDASLISFAGVMLTISHDGTVVATEGLVRRQDQKRVDAVRKQGGGEGDDAESREDADGVAETGRRSSALPKAVNRDLTLARTRALRLVLSGDPDVALALCVSALAHRCLHNAEMTGVAIAAHLREVDDLPALDEAWAELEGRLPAAEADLLDWALDLSRERLLAVLAVLVAGSVDLAHEDTSASDLRKQAIADALALRLDIDMTRYWKADPGFWARLPKSALMTALVESPGMSERGARTRDEVVKAHAKLRKEELAAKVSAAFEGAGYLPDILLTPATRGGLAITPEGSAAIAPTAVASSH
jgi:ParB family chromosome partitioning protein